MARLWLLTVGIGGVAGLAFFIIAGRVVLRHWLEQRLKSRLQSAKHEFHLRREWLEAAFVTAASKSGRPRGLDWVDCDFQDEVSFARDRHSGRLCALVGVAISFKAVEGGEMEDNPNVENSKAGSAVFRFDGRHWSTDGRALLNLDPDEAIERLRNELETVD